MRKNENGLQWTVPETAQEKLHFLSTYMGHRDLHSTLVYITVTQDLLQEASERFRALGAPCLGMEVRL